MEVILGQTKLVLMQGDITVQDTEAIVNAANEGLRGGGGVDGAIHRAGGPAIAEECRRIREERGGCPTGQAVLTSGGWLKARYVIHAVGPIWSGGNKGEDNLLASAYRNSLELAREHGIKSLSFPSLSTGAYRFPVDRAARIAMRTVVEYLEQHPDTFTEIRFILFSEPILKAYEEALNELLATKG
ncbi:O-acetyl-ADP-ribose deacetylase (regulator of RNase III), contains Macro domain [Thermanaeromonas toyohensis ToBE]|uniref:O-acetyl-ADP-ribose deacetylase (Regulator of RNase III), contains Macro domain n=1 Tax=Thermanaeromonas toyohensis ToBE TaxID=698762 RepID=A0A1W1VG64_9FIRM|nr:O-acetyl-ADP-ribose deacetylase [Thermanaeromonas toyohensis]SMB92342.1 O-acetyl-ADP-ribose deacetylase (regulator of RNase III), contains Macro domain [Thermanaeromonas toyohensis ToBE]